jgi:FXSXX-COOH protein
MTTLHLPGDEPQPHTAEGPDRVPLVRLARDGGSPALARIVAAGGESRGPGRVSVAAFNSSV